MSQQSAVKRMDTSPKCHPQSIQDILNKKQRLLSARKQPQSQAQYPLMPNILQDLDKPYIALHSATIDDRRNQ